MLSKRNRIAIVTGGYGPERDSSLASGRIVASVLAEKGYRTCSYVANDAALPGFPAYIDMAFLTVRGRFGSGQLQRIMDEQGIPFTGSSAATCRLAFDRRSTRRRLRACGIPVPRESSRKGLSRIPKGKILHAVVLGRRVLPLVPETPDEGESAESASLPSLEEARLRKYALAVYNAVEGSGYASVRVMVGQSRLMVLDVDPVPSFERGSPVRRALDAAGISLEECFERIMESVLNAIPQVGIRKAAGRRVA
ncbi:MAG: D-alanine--D-alanine ligase family protein [Planctomycetota bacterium]